MSVGDAKPILFSTAMVQAIRAGKKTQTRRTPYGCRRERLWVRETWATSRGLDHVPPGRLAEGAPIQYKAGGSNLMSGDPLVDRGRWRPSIHMPRWAARLELLIEDIRVERLQAMSAGDALAEGIIRVNIPPNEDHPALVGYTVYPDDGKAGLSVSPIECYAALWDSINGKRAPWDSNPWVWVVSFRMV